MKPILLIGLILQMAVLPSALFAWGQTGHRTVGQVAENHMSKKALKNVHAVLGGESVAMAANWMDFIKSDPQYRYMGQWHYCTVPDSLTYEQAGTPEGGDVYVKINQFIEEIKTGNYSVDETFALKCLIHLVGDVHQPMHVGNGEDRGGNDVKLKFFNKTTNLHRVWDSDMIDRQKLSYTEYAAWIDVAPKDQVLIWQQTPVMGWINESKELRPSAYDLGGKKNLMFRYIFDHIDEVNLRLEQAGIRLAGILDELYG